MWDLDDLLQGGGNTTQSNSAADHNGDDEMDMDTLPQFSQGISALTCKFY